MGLVLAQMLNFYQGYTHESLMRLRWDLFMMYYDNMVYILREQTEEGRKKNRAIDRRLGNADDGIEQFKQMMRTGFMKK